MNCLSILMLAKTISVVLGSIVGANCNSPYKEKVFRTASLLPPTACY